MNHRNPARRHITSRLAITAAFAVLTGGLMAGTPAQALDDGNQGFFETVKGIAGSAIGFGLGSSDEDEPPRIEYRERAPLVLPPKIELRPPGASVTERNPNWPKDYEISRREKSALARAREQKPDALGTYRMSNEELARGRIAPGQRNVNDEQCGVGGTNGLGEICNPSVYWNVMKTTRKEDETTKDVPAGAEPPRKALTDPPVGMRRTMKTVKYVPEAPKEEVNLNDPRAQLREDQRRESGRDR
jgi:hypothetical protein